MPVRIVIDTFMPSFFVARATPSEATRAAHHRKQLPLTDLAGAPVDCLYFSTYAALQQCSRDLRAAGLRPLESDIHPVERFLMERLVRGGMRVEGTAVKKGRYLELRNPLIRGDGAGAVLTTLSIDIETNADTGELYCIACCGAEDIVLMAGEGANGQGIEYCGGEPQLLRRFIAYLQETDPDVIIGWNVVDFDLAVMQQRCAAHNIPFDVGREPGARILASSDRAGDGRGRSERHTARVPGRAVLDVPAMLRAFHRTFEEYSLDYVAGRMLGRHKTIEAAGQEKIDEINRLFREDRQSLAAYNLRDAALTKEIFDKAMILPNAIERARRCGHLLDRSGGSVAAFDYLYLPLLHRAGYVSRDVADVTPPAAPLPGGYVMESQPGIYENVLLLDFKSLYPTIIMTFRIDPLGHAVQGGARIQGPAGPSFSRDASILPKIISELMQARAEAKRVHNESLSQVIKILMNSFYGVLGTPGCRFFSFELASAITGIGRYILRATRDYIEQSFGTKVIYGDTDSLFVLLGPAGEGRAAQRGRDMVAQTNAWLAKHISERFGADSALELEFETHFRFFFMPAIRGSAVGSKKRYCGAVEQDGGLTLVFKGLEAARSDWTEMAKRFQRDLYLRVFTGQPVEDFIRQIVDQIKRGEHDQYLVYRKGVRKRLEQYTDHIPPHIQAARMLGGRPPSRIAYVMTVDGPQPLEKVTAKLDYTHYIETQLAPVAEAILEWKGIRFESILSGQQDLFGGAAKN